MTPTIDPSSAARILDLAEARGSRSVALAGFAAILLLAAHAALSGGSPTSAQAAAMSPAGARIHARESAQMKQLMAIGLAAAVSSGASAQNAVQWRVEDGGNGHWYTVRENGGSWLDAKSACEATGGHLATLTSASENLFAWQVLGSSGLNPCFAMLGGFQDVSSADYSEPSGGWRWVSGEPWAFSAWFSIEPNNGAGAGSENYLTFRQFDCGARWNDTPAIATPTDQQYLIEWDADCNADGIVDYGQILAGELDDANTNNIPDCCESGVLCGCSGDTNSDGFVDGIDLATVLTRWAQPATKFPDADCNHDGVIDGADLSIVLGSWGVCP